MCYIADFLFICVSVRLFVGLVVYLIVCFLIYILLRSYGHFFPAQKYQVYPVPDQEKFLLRCFLLDKMYWTLCA